MTDTAPSVPDGLELRKDGTIRLTIDGRPWRLRRPKLGEFRTLRESLRDREDANVRLLAEAQASNGDKPTDDATPTEKAERTLALHNRSRTLADAVTDLNIAWMEQMLGMLTDSPPPPPDDWPVGMESSDTIAAIVNHWRSSPLRSGGS